ncbi:MAG TPA: hypothetical protein VHG71_04460 [Verrucomicrobiae bacterium]|nr:hypothetical protein [Verrucomicrobiae bacterium]
MISTLICFALKEEAAPFQKIAGGLHRSHHILLTGIGRANAEKSLREFLSKNSPELVLTCGFAGGLNPELKLGDVFFETPLSPLSGERVAKPGEGNLISKLISVGAKPAKFFCADRITTTVAEKQKLREQTGADVVEMESATIHAVCAEKKILCATVRVISDTAHEDLPLDFNTLAKPDKNLDFSKLVWAIAKSPGKISALIKLRKQTKFAAERLAVVLEKIVFP